MKQIKLISISVLLALSVVSVYSASAVPDNIAPGSIAPSQVMQNIQIPQQKSLKQNAKPLVDTEEQEAEAEVEASPQADFVLKQIEITGAPKQSIAALKAIYQPKLNRPADLNSLQHLANQLQAALREQGYILAQVILPPQRIQKLSGVVKFQVIEGEIAKVNFSGDSPNGAGAQLQRYASQLENTAPMTFAELENYLSLMDQLPGIDARGVLTPSQTPGAADLNVDVTQRPLTGYLGYNNRGTSYIGQSQVQGGFNINDILGADSFAFNYATSLPQPDELDYFNTSYSIVPFQSGLQITPSLTYVDTAPGQELALFNTVGQSTKYALDFMQPLKRSRMQNFSLLGGIYYLDSRNNILGYQIYNDQISALNLGLGYNGLFGGGWNDAKLMATEGVPLFGTQKTVQNPSRVGGVAEFTKLNFDFTHTRYLTQRTSVVLASDMQYSPNPLLVPEEIGYGGALFGQAYNPSEIIGDSGLMGSFALRYDLPQFVPSLTLLQPFAFYDIGKVWANSTWQQEGYSISGASVGMGLNFGITKTWQGSLTFAYPLTLTPIEMGYKSWRTFVSIVGLF